MQTFRKFLYPFGILYGIIVSIRNFLYFSGLKSRFVVPGKSIVVGNLAVGGTGKTPHVAFLAQLLLEKHNKIQIISRGYGRKTKGFLQVDLDSASIDVGDEPLLLKKRFQDVEVAVCEQRKFAIEKIESFYSPDVYVFDDAFQHLSIKAGLNIIITTFQQPFFEDFMLPSGNLREFRNGVKRADLVIVSKCPKNLSVDEKNIFIKKIGLDVDSIFFSHIYYGALIPFSNIQKAEFSKVLLVTGIADPQPLKEYLEAKYEVQSVEFGDHHNFTEEDLTLIQEKFDTFAKDGNGVVVTTEKDFMRLSNNRFERFINKLPWCYQPIDIQLDNEKELINKILNYVGTI